MFKNIGMKVKQIAQIGFWVGIGLSGVSCIVLLVVGVLTSPVLCLVGILSGLLGALLTWVACVFAYGFGEQIENTAVIATLMVKADAEKHAAP